MTAASADKLSFFKSFIDKVSFHVPAPQDPEHVRLMLSAGAGIVGCGDDSNEVMASLPRSVAASPLLVGFSLLRNGFFSAATENEIEQLARNVRIDIRIEDPCRLALVRLTKEREWSKKREEFLTSTPSLLIDGKFPDDFAQTLHIDLSVQNFGKITDENNNLVTWEQLRHRLLSERPFSGVDANAALRLGFNHPNLSTTSVTTSIQNISPMLNRVPLPILFMMAGTVLRKTSPIEHIYGDFYKIDAALADPSGAIVKISLHPYRQKYHKSTRKSESLSPEPIHIILKLKKDGSGSVAAEVRSDRERLRCLPLRSGFSQPNIETEDEEEEEECTTPTKKRAPFRVRESAAYENEGDDDN